MKRILAGGIVLGVALVCGCSHGRSGHTLRILTWAGYAPRAVVEQFEHQTGIHVEVTVSNNEEMISKLRATGGAGYDLAQPSQDRILGPQEEFGIYKPLDLSRVHLGEFRPSLLAVTRKTTTIGGKVYALPYLFGTDGLVVNTKVAPQVKDYTDLCLPALKGKTAVRLKRPTLIAFAFAEGQDPFALYGDPQAYTALMNRVGAALIACKPNFRFFYDNKDQLLDAFRSGEVDAAMMWDTGGWTLNRENPIIQYLVPKSGALGWLDTFALPAHGRNDAAAYAWINFTMQPRIAAQIVDSVGSFSAAKGAEPYIDPRLKAQYAAAFPTEASLAQIHWYPAIPAGLELIEGRILDRIKAAD
ncbi:MAG TPA: extracellular solute-binding protein [Steroidobacteraceae bacterium]|nr:extracellular solute-binding protein [Steroidobacteraceae bacterium]